MVKALTPLLLCVALAAFADAQRATWIDVPFVKQPAEGCGAASIAMVMQYWEHHDLNAPRLSPVRTTETSSASDVGHIQQQLYSKPAHGIYASGLQQYLTTHRFATYVVHGDLALVAHHIERGRPLIVALKPTSAQAFHYVVVAGVDPSEHTVLVNDPAQRKLLKVDSSAFEKEWQATGNWTLLALPHTAQPQ
jgi:ABC-type bacteriocin/lantibiotic exporter with double-glycine peptidase domain